MKVVAKEVQFCQFDALSKGDPFLFGGEFYIKFAEEVYDADDGPLNAVHAKTGDVVHFRFNELVDPVPNAKIVIG